MAVLDNPSTAEKLPPKVPCAHPPVQPNDHTLRHYRTMDKEIVNLLNLCGKKINIQKSSSALVPGLTRKREGKIAHNVNTHTVCRGCKCNGFCLSLSTTLVKDQHFCGGIVPIASIDNLGERIA